ncbi:hypothetical protein [Mycoplasma todarodis]|nr:hypothetical protein [Mycoplasma todarodis]
MSSHKIKKIFKGEETEAREWYIHRIVSQWFSEQEENLSRDTMDKLKKIIKKTKMQLNELEKHEMIKIEERIFSTERTLKILDTYHELLPNEVVVARFNMAYLYAMDKEEITLRISKKKQFWTEEDILRERYSGSLLISNKRFIIELNKKIKEIKFEDIESYRHKEHGFEFFMEDETFILRTHDQKTLNNTIDLIFRKKAKHVIEKRKDS